MPINSHVCAILNLVNTCYPRELNGPSPKMAPFFLLRRPNYHNYIIQRTQWRHLRISAYRLPVDEKTTSACPHDLTRAVAIAAVAEPGPSLRGITGAANLLSFIFCIHVLSRFACLVSRCRRCGPWRGVRRWDSGGGGVVADDAGNDATEDGAACSSGGGAVGVAGWRRTRRGTTWRRRQGGSG